MGQVKITLFYSNKCPHSLKFLPEWKELKKHFAINSCVDLTELEIDSEKFKDYLLSGDPISCVPTVAITTHSKSTYHEGAFVYLDLKNEIAKLISNVSHNKCDNSIELECKYPFDDSTK